MRYPVVTLCGSTRFKKEFETVQKKLTLDGCIVLSVGLFGHSGDDEVWEQMDEGTKTSTKMMLDDMHKTKIDMADSIFVVNPGGYIGESTKSEICYAYMLGKHIDSLVPISLEEVKVLVFKHIAKAELYAKYQLDGAAHQGIYGTYNCEILRHKGVDVLDPWIREDRQGDMWAWEQHANEEIAVDPFKYYGKKKTARFIENIVMRRDNMADKGYKVIAGFYNKGTARMVADIIKSGYEHDKTEACIVMINPGSCEEIDETDVICPSDYNMPELGSDVVYNECKPDPAQKCVIELMKECEINRIRIVNLYDLREPKLDEVKKEMKEYKANPREAKLCIFADERKEDRKIVFDGIKVAFLSWGVDTYFKNYKELAYKKIHELVHEGPIIWDSRHNDLKSAYSCRYIKPWNIEEQKLVRKNLSDEYKKCKEVLDIMRKRGK